MIKHFFLFVICIAFNLQAQHAQSIEYGDCFFLKGTISNIPITMHLSQQGDDFTGNYYYDKYQIRINVAGKFNRYLNKIELKSEVAQKTETFSLSNQTNGFVGDWISGSKTLPVKLEKANIPFTFRKYSQSINLPLRSNIQDGPTLSSNVALVWPVEESPAANFIRENIMGLLGEKIKSSSTNPEDLILSINNDYKNNYFETHKEENDEEIKDRGSSYSETHDVIISIYELNDRILTLEQGFYDYAGGAHGFGGIVFANLDIKSRKALKLSSLFTSVGLKQLPRLLEEQFRKDQKLKPGQSLEDGGLFENKIKEATDNFYLTQKGVGFYYQQYEIAPYAAGPIEIYLPFSKIKPLLYPSACSYFTP